MQEVSRMNWNEESFCALILTHGRAENLDTTSTLRRQGYTGPIKYLIDNRDEQADLYIKRFGNDNIFIFDKDEWVAKVDKACNFGDDRSVVYARNAAFQIMRDAGYEYFLMLDDDYTNFQYKFRSDKTFHAKTIANLDTTFKAFLDYLKSTKIKTICFAQGGDFIGGGASNKAKAITAWRKAMNAFFVRSDNPIPFVGTVNEDVNAYVNDGKTSRPYLTHNMVSLVQRITQTNKGGLTDIYLSQGTYVKSFYSIIFEPSCVKISMMGMKEFRLHHHVKWNLAAPKIISAKYKK